MIVLSYYQNKIVSLEKAGLISDQKQKHNKNVVLTTGNYDIFHPGHLFFLEDAKQKGGILIVGIADDQLIKQSKNPGRPIFKAMDRARIVAAIGFVDYVVIFSNIFKIIEIVRPNTLIISPTSNKKYNKQKIDLAKSLGIKIEVILSRYSLHTSNIINKIKNLKNA